MASVSIGRVSTVYLLSSLIALTVIVSTQSLRIADVKEFQDVDGLDDISCEASLAFGGQRTRLLDTPEKISRFAKSLHAGLQDTFRAIKDATQQFDMSIFTDEDMRRLLNYIRKNMNPNDFQNSLNAKRFLTSPPPMVFELLKKWIPAFRLLQKPKVMCEYNEMIPLEGFEYLCEHLSSFETTVRQMSIMEDRCAHCTAYIVKHRQQEHLTDIVEGGKGRVLYKLIRKVYPDDWDLYFLRFSPGSVKPEDIARIDPTHFSDRVQQKMILANRDIWGRFRKTVMAAIAEALLTAIGPIARWPGQNMKMFGQYVMCLPQDRLDDILEPQMFLNMDIKDLMDKPMADRFFKTAVWKVVDYFDDPDKHAEFNALPDKNTVICLILKYAPMKSLFDNLITINMTKTALMECMDHDFKDRRLSFLLKKIIHDPSFGWTSKELLQIDVLMPLLPPSMLENITNVNLMEYWMNKMATFDFPLTKAIMERIGKRLIFKIPSCEKMEMLAEGILTLSREELDIIPLPVYTTCAHVYLRYLDHNCHYAPRVCGYIWKKIKESRKTTRVPMVGLMQNMTGEFVEEFIPTADFEDLDVDEDADPEELAKGLNDIPMDDLHAKVLYRKMKNTFGNLSSENTDISDKRDAFKLFGKGSSVEDLQKLPEDGSLMNVVPEIAEDVGKDNKKKISVVYDKLHSVLGMDTSGGDDLCIDEEMADDLAGFFTQARQGDLDKLRPESKKDILKSIGDKEEYVQQMTRPKLQSFFREQLNATKLHQADRITPSDVETVGPHLFCGMTKDDAKKLTNEAVTANLETFEKCEQLDQETRGELASKYVNAKGGVKEMLKSPVDLQSMETLLPYIEVNPEDLTKREKEKFKLLSDEILDTIGGRLERLDERTGRDIPDEEKDAEKSQRSRFNRKLVQLTSDDDDEGIDCQTLQSFGDDLNFLEEEDFKKMELHDFDDCLEAFHGTSWEEKQLKVIKHKLKEVYGDDTGKWDEDVRMRVGPLISALDSSDIEKMDFSKDAIAYMGSFDIGGKQASRIIKKFQKDMGLEESQEIPSDLLASFGQLICGFTPEDIENMNSTVVLEAASHFADVACLEEDQLIAVMDRLKDKLGSDWSDLAADKIEEFGILMGGAPEDILASLGEEQLASIKGKALEKIPPRTFAGAFDAEKLQQLSDEQAMHLKPEHMWKMDSTQRQALSNLTRKSGFSAPKATHKGVQGSSSREFQKGRNLPRSSCGSTFAFAGQRDDLLDTPNKVAKFIKTLKGETQKFFQELVASEDHSISDFTAGEMQNTLDFLMESVSEEDRADFMSILDNFDYISIDTLREMLMEWPPNIHLLQKPDVMCQVTHLLDKDLLKTFCDRIVDSDVTAAVTTEILERCADCVVLRFIDRENYEHMPPMEDAKASVFMRKLRQMKFPDWDLNTFAIAPAALKPEDVDKITDLGHFRNKSQLEVFLNDDVDCCLKKAVKKKIASKLHQALGPLSDWSDEIVERVGQFIPYFSDSDQESELTGSVVLKNLDYMRPGGQDDEYYGDDEEEGSYDDDGADFYDDDDDDDNDDDYDADDYEEYADDDEDEISAEDKKTMTTAAWNLAEHLSRNAESISEEDKMKSFCLLASFPPKQSVFDSIYNMDEMRTGLQNCSDWKIDDEMSVRVLSKISQSPRHSWDSEDIQLLQKFPSGVTPNIIDTINKTTLLKKWGKLKDADFSKPVLRSAWNKLKSNFTLETIKCDKIRRMGKMFLALSLKEIDSISEESLADCVGYLSRIVVKTCDKERKICDKLWSKVDASIKANKNRTKKATIRKLYRKFLRFVPADDFKNMSIADLGGLDRIGEMDLDPLQAEAVLEIVEKEKGPVSKDNLNYSGRHLKKLGNVFIQGASTENLENLPEGTELLDSLPAIKRNMKSMKEEKVEAVYGKLHNMFGMDSDQPVCLDETTVKQVAGFFTKASREDLQKLNDETRKSVLSEIGKDRDTVNTMTRDKVREQFRVLKDTENFDSRDKIPEDDLDKYGPNLFCGMEKEDVQKLSDRTLEEHVADFDKCDQLDPETRKEIADKFVSASKGMTELLKKADKLKSMGSLVLAAEFPDPSTMTSDQKEVLKSVAGDIMTEVNGRKERLQKRSDNEIPQAEKTEEQFLRSEFTRNLWDVVSDGVDCPTIQSFEGDLEFMGVSDIEGLSPDVVTECLGEFQEVEWDKDQLKSFGGKIKEGFGDDTREWNKDRVMRTGKLLSGLESEDIDKLTLDEDVIGVIGQSEVAEPEKMYKKFKEDAGIKNVSSVDADTLRGMGTIVCAMKPKEMKDLPKKVIKDVISDLSDIDCLDDDQIQVITDKYQYSVTDEELGEMDMASLGVFAGGLEEDKLKRLDEEQLSRIPPDAMKKMKPETFTKAFDSEKMSKLTKEQLTSLDAKVLRKMDVSQLIALENVAKGKKNVNATEMAKNKTKRFHIDLPDDVAVQTLETFQEVRNLAKENCGGISFAGQDENRLDTPEKRHAFNLSLPNAQAVMFGRILASQDHDVSPFTTFEMRKILKYLTKEMSADDQDAYIDLRTEFASLTPDELNETLHTLPPNLYLLMKPRLMCNTLGQMDVGSVDTFCERLTSRDVTTATFIEILNRCGDCLAVAHAHRTDEDIIGMMRGYKGKAFYDKLKQWLPGGWDVYHLMFAPSSLEMDDIEHITDLDHFKDFGQIARLADPRFFEAVRKPVMVALAKRLHQALGSLSEWSFIQNNMLLPYILNFPPKILEQEMKVSTVLSILSNIEDIMGIASEKFMSISAWKITDYLVKNARSVPKDIKEKVFCMVLKYTNHKKLWRRVYSPSELSDYLPKCAVYDIPEDNIANLIRRIIKTKGFTLDQEGFDMLGDFIAALPIYALQQADPDLLYANWGVVGNLDFKFGKLRQLWTKIKDKVDLKSLTCDDIKHLGRAVLILQSKELQKIPGKAMGQCASHLGELLHSVCEERKHLCKTMWEKVKAYAQDGSIPLGSVVKDLGKDFIKHVPQDDIKTIDIDDLGGVESLSRLEPNVDQAPVLMRKVKSQLGPVTSDNTNYTAEAVMELGPVFFFGATCSEFEILPEDSSLLEMLPKMAEYFTDLNEKKIEIIFNKLKKIFAVDNTDNICLDRPLAEQIAMFFTAARADDIRKLSDESKKAIFQTLGGNRHYVDKMSRSKIQELFSVLLETDSLGSKDSFEDKDVGNYQYMWCGQTSDQAQRLSAEAIDGYMSLMHDCVHLEPMTKDSLVQRSIDVSGTLSDLLTSNPKRLEDLGSLIIHVDSDAVRALDSELQEVFVSSTDKLMKSVTEIQKEAEKRPSADISEDEVEQTRRNMKELGRVMFDIMLPLLSDDGNTRRKRSTTPVDCPTIQSFNGALSFMTPEEIAAIENDEFEDCLEEFQSTTWDDSQLDAFQTQIVTSFGSDTSTWSQDNVLSCGILLDSLDPEQIENLTVLDTDTVSSLGSNVFANNAPYIMDAYLTGQNITDLSQVDADTLGSTGNLICGFNTSQMAKMESSTIDGASSDLSSVSCLDSDQLTTIGNKIVEIRGTDWTGATSDEISSLGVLAGGLPASVLEDIGTDELSSLSPQAVENMSPETFSNVFTAEKIESLSSAQANSLTDGQRALLSDDQLYAVSAVATTTTDNENGATNQTANWMTAFLLVIITAIIREHQ